MSYCINPWCPERQNPDHLERCQACDTPLLINERYRLIRPLKDLSTQSYTEVWLADCYGTPKVLKSLIENRPTLVKLFGREAQVLRQLLHPGIPHLETDFIFAPSNGPKKLHCLVLEKIEGENLEQWIADNGPISQELAWEWLKELTQILHDLHQERFFHRDIKPSNIMRTPDGRLMLIDFGAVRKITGTYLEKIDQQQETTGVYSVGGYTPAEQILGRAVPQSDFFALGRTCVYWLTGKLPTEFENLETGELVGWRDSLPKLSQSLADLIDELMAPSPEKRPHSTQVILQRLEQIDLSVKSQRIPKHNPRSRREVGSLKVGFKFASLLLLGGIVSFLVVKPQIATFFNELGLKNHRQGQLFAAQRYYRLAILLNPQFAQPYYNLGWLCQESLNDSICARKAYQQAALRRFPAANAELARLQIMDNNLVAALKTTEYGLQWANSKPVKAALLKNRGWIRWQQHRLDEAEDDLRSAIAIERDSPHSYCLLAQVLEAKGKPEALEAWKNTYESSEYRAPEQDNCIAISRQRLQAKGYQP
jgi:serine/threonine protein kinase